jgi:large subunit ribosomal protein L17
MRHRNAGFKLGRNTSHRRALLRNLVTSVIIEDRVETTVAKAKAVRPLVEKMITLGKKGDLHSRRQALSFLMTDAVERLFDTVAPRYGDRAGRLSAHRAHRLPEGRRRRKGLHRTAGRRKAAGSEAPEARRDQGQEARRARKAVGREQEGRAGRSGRFSAGSLQLKANPNPACRY